MSENTNENNGSPWIPNTKTFYDKVFYNTLHFKKKKGSTNEFGIELDAVLPSAGEIRLLGNRH